MGVISREELVAQAWSEYLCSCRASSGDRYEDVIEPLAWARLLRRLAAINRAANRGSRKIKALA